MTRDENQIAQTFSAEIGVHLYWLEPALVAMQPPDEDARLRALGEKYISNLLVAMDANIKLNEYSAARRQAISLLELRHLLSPSVETAVTEKLALPAMAAADSAASLKRVKECFT